MPARTDTDRLTATQRTALTELTRTGALWDSQCSADSRWRRATLNALVDAGYATWVVRPGSGVMPHVRVRPVAAAALAADPEMSAQDTVVVCATCEDYVEYPLLVRTGNRWGDEWVHRENGQARCPGQGDDDTHDEAEPSEPRPARHYPEQGRFLLDLESTS